MAQDIEAELAAIKALQATLEPLKPDARTRVIGYAFSALGITVPQNPPAPTVPLALATIVPPPHPQNLPPGSPTDILTLKEEKQPSSSIQMIAVMSYYLAQLAPANERRDYITVEDIQKYFVQARYPLPGAPSQALIHAKNAGYLDAIEAGKYRLNSVGHNLVAHKMPGDGTAPRKSGSKKKAAKKAAKKTKKK